MAGLCNQWRRRAGTTGGGCDGREGRGDGEGPGRVVEGWIDLQALAQQVHVSTAEHAELAAITRELNAARHDVATSARRLAAMRRRLAARLQREEG
jgi:hypothetical protein